MSESAHDAAFVRMIAARVAPMSWVAVATELLADWCRPNGNDLAKLLQKNFASWNCIAEGELLKTAGDAVRATP